MDRYETVVFCNDDVNVYVLCSKAEGKAIYIDSGGNGEVIVHTRPDTLFSNKFQCDYIWLIAKRIDMFCTRPGRKGDTPFTELSIGNWIISKSYVKK